MNIGMIICLERNNPLLHDQHGFRMGQGTVTASAIIYETIALHASNKDQCYVILKDVSKASDKVWHDGLNTNCYI